jgi:hypothetical protein
MRLNFYSGQSSFHPQHAAQARDPASELPRLGGGDADHTERSNQKNVAKASLAVFPNAATPSSAIRGAEL